MYTYLAFKKDVKILAQLISNIDDQLNMFETKLRTNDVFYGTINIKAIKINDVKSSSHTGSSPVEVMMEKNCNKILNEIKDLKVLKEQYEVELVIKKNQINVYEISVLSELSNQDRELLNLLSEMGDMTKISQKLHFDKSTIYRRKKRIQKIFDNHNQNPTPPNIRKSKNITTSRHNIIEN